MILAMLLMQTVQTTPDVVVTAPPAAIQQAPATIVVEPAAMFIAACDADGDAIVTRAELSACVARSFAEADTGKTGSLRYLAYSDWALKWLGDRTALPSPYDVDRNSDDQITLAELQDYFAKLYSRFDRDREGRVPRANLLTFKARAIDANGPVGGAPRPGRKPPR